MRKQCPDKELEKLSMDVALQIIPQLERIIFKLYCYGLSLEDIAMVVDRKESDIMKKISKTREILKDFSDYVTD